MLKIMKKVLILSASPRLNGNSDLLAKAFQKGAEESGNQTELIELAQKKINYCHGCYYCASHGPIHRGFECQFEPNGRKFLPRCPKFS